MKEWLPLIIALVGLIIYGLWFWKYKAEEYGSRNEDTDKESSYDIGDDL